MLVSEITSNIVPDLPESDAVECEIINRSSQSLTVKMPGTIKPGSYNLWVTNQYGTSEAIGLNTARPQWVSDDVICRDNIFDVYGRNMSAGEFGSDNSSGVSFVSDNGDAYDIPIISVNPYAIKCRLNDVPPGEYTVYVTNDGYIWNEPEDKRKVCVVGDVYDPYKLGAAMAQQFNFNNVINISNMPYAAMPGADITGKLQAAVDNLNQIGGGIVYIPAGEYKISSVKLKSGVVIAGAGMGKTRLLCNGGEYALSSGNNSRTGIVDLSLEQTEGNSAPAFFVVLGKQFDKTYVKTRTVEYAFMKRVELKGNMDFNEQTDNNGLGVMAGGKSHILIEDCRMEGSLMTISSSYVGEYTKIKNNYINSAVGNVSVIGEYVTAVNNKIIHSSKSYPRDVNTQGIFMRGYSYIAENEFKNLYNENTGNDGEIVCTENYMGGLKLDGYIESAGADTVTLNVTGLSDWTLDEIYYGKAYLVITDGTGVGQYSKIESFDKNTKTLKLEKSFKILPNSKSRFIVASMSENATIYKNSCENSEKGYWLYGDNIDSAVAYNSGINTEGVYLRGIYKESTGDNRRAIGYFVNIENNNFSGGSVHSGVCGIGVGMNSEGPEPSMKYIYGVSIKDNSIKNNIASDAVSNGHEAPHLNGIYIDYRVTVKQNAHSKIISNVIIENNTISDCDRGITIGPFGYPNHTSQRSYALGDMTENIHIGENVFNNVSNEFVDERGYVFGG